MLILRTLRRRITIEAAMTKTGWAHGNAPPTVFEHHLKSKHGKSTSWVEGQGDDLRTAHKQEHDSGGLSHDLDEMDI